MKFPVSLLATVLSLLMAGPLSASDFPPVRDLMSPEEMEVTGLDKLSDDELQALREWLEVFVERDARFAIEAYRRAQKEAEREAREIDQEREVAQREQKREQKRQQKQSAGEEKPQRNRFDKSYARIVGEFSGWNGKTRFTLDNGEVWEQRKPDSMRHMQSLTNPEVRITKNFLGFFVMEVPEADVKVPVSRIK